MRTLRRVKHKARGGSVRPSKREADERASANGAPRSRSRFSIGRDIEGLVGQLMTAPASLPSS
jgi:hypothetical protein